jgi:hypothetical protein
MVLILYLFTIIKTSRHIDTHLSDVQLFPQLSTVEILLHPTFHQVRVFRWNLPQESGGGAKLNHRAALCKVLEGLLRICDRNRKYGVDVKG